MRRGESGGCGCATVSWGRPDRGVRRITKECKVVKPKRNKRKVTEGRLLGMGPSATTCCATRRDRRARGQRLSGPINGFVRRTSRPLWFCFDRVKRRLLNAPRNRSREIGCSVAAVESIAFDFLTAAAAVTEAHHKSVRRVPSSAHDLSEFGVSIGRGVCGSA